jgi:hypothetical protein
MKKLSLLLAVIILCLMPAAALAEGETPGDEIPGGDQGAGSVLSIDNNYVYDGMDRAYKDGYTPTVSEA